MSDEAVPGNEQRDDVPGRRQIWVRAGAGISLIVLLLGALAILDRGGRDEPPARPDRSTPRPGPAEPAATVVSEPRAPLVGTAVALPARDEAAPLRVKAEAAALEGAPEHTAAPEIRAPEQRQADAPPPAAVNAGALAAAGRPPPEQAREVAPEPEAAEPPAKADKPAARVQAGQGGFLVQLGVFGVPGNAESLYAELQRLGVPARLETRVVAGPFANRKAADEASERLVRAGVAKGMVVKSR